MQTNDANHACTSVKLCRNANLIYLLRSNERTETKQLLMITIKHLLINDA